MKPYRDQVIEKYQTAETFVESYATGSQDLNGDPYPEWAAVLKALIPIMRDNGLDASDIFHALEEDLEILEYLIDHEKGINKSNAGD